MHNDNEEIKNEIKDELDYYKSIAKSTVLFVFRWGIMYIGAILFIVPFIRISIEPFEWYRSPDDKILYFCFSMFSLCVFITLLAQYYTNKKSYIITKGSVKSVIKANIADIMLFIIMIAVLVIPST